MTGQRVYWWSHWETGSPLSNFARCNECGENMVFWSPKAGVSVPPTARKKIDAHRLTHPGGRCLGLPPAPEPEPEEASLF